MVGDHVSHKPPRTVTHAVLDSANHLGCERAVDDLAQPKVTGIVQADHRTGKFCDLGGHVIERGARRDRTEDLGVAARVMNVVVGRQGPVPGARGETRELGNLKEGDR
jgi:hypothetical protein